MLRPRLTEHHGINLSQEKVDFLIPFLGEDIPLCIDPFLLWKSPSQHYQSLHNLVVGAFNSLGYAYFKGEKQLTKSVLVALSECDELGLGFSSKGKGRKISKKQAEGILELFCDIPQLQQNGFRHFEIIQVLIEGISKDRISDITGSILKSYLIDYTIQQCAHLGIPTSDDIVITTLDAPKLKLKEERVSLPVNPETQEPIILVPKYWLRRGSWISSDDYIEGFLSKQVLDDNIAKPSKGEIPTFSRVNYGLVEEYLAVKERTAENCSNDPIFSPIPLLSLKRKMKALESLPPGIENKSDKIYEEIVYHVLTTTFFPHLDFAAPQSRTDSGVLIRDLIFYNNQTIDFLGEILRQYESKQLVFEIKNVSEVNREHIFQLNRYLNEHFGRFGVIVTRNPIPKRVLKNAIDLWSGQRRCIVFLTDVELSLMVDLFESKQRMPIEVLKKQYIQFTRECPS